MKTSAVNRKKLIKIVQKYINKGFTVKEVVDKIKDETGVSIPYGRIDRWITNKWVCRDTPAKKFVPIKLFEKAQELLNLGLDYATIAKELSSSERAVTNDTISSWVKRGKIFRVLPESPRYDDYLRLSGDYVVCSDTQIPFTDMVLTKHMIDIAKLFKIRKLVIAGDFLDQTGLSMKFKEHGSNLKEELQAARDFLKYLNTWFREIHLFVGNHDIRLLRLAEFKLGVEDMFKMISTKWKMNPYPKCKITSGGKIFYITHPDSYSRNATRVAQTINHREQCSVLVAHGHAMGVTFSPSGKEICGDTGGLFDQTKIKYKNQKDTTHGNWISGFSIIRNGYLYQFPKNFTDWPFWKNIVIPKA